MATKSERICGDEFLQGLVRRQYPTSKNAQGFPVGLFLDWYEHAKDVPVKVGDGERPLALFDLYSVLAFFATDIQWAIEGLGEHEQTFDLPKLYHGKSVDRVLMHDAWCEAINLWPRIWALVSDKTRLAIKACGVKVVAQ